MTTNESSVDTGTLAGIAAILQAIAWPIVFSLLLIIYRSRIWSLIEVITIKIGDATNFKLWQLEIYTAGKEIKRVVQQTGETAGGGIETGEIPESQRRAAEQIDNTLKSAQLSLSEDMAISVVQGQVKSLVKDYERIRAEMVPGSRRTRRMNEIAGEMRALSLVGRPLLRTLTSGESVGERLAAICFLQVVPEFGYFNWLVERILSENQAFLLFQAAVAIFNLVKKHQYADKATVKKAIEQAVQHVSDFKGGTPDTNTINVLNAALKQLQ